MEIHLFKTKSENNVVYKTLTDQKTITCTLKERTSVINPIIYLTNDENIPLREFNYCNIPIFNRFYYITDITAINNNMWEIKLSVDVLMSFKESFSQFDVVISKNEIYKNNMLNDKDVKHLAYRNVKTVKFPQTPLNKSNMNFILTTIGSVKND